MREGKENDEIRESSFRYPCNRRGGWTFVETSGDGGDGAARLRRGENTHGRLLARPLSVLCSESAFLSAYREELYQTDKAKSELLQFGNI